MNIFSLYLINCVQPQMFRKMRADLASMWSASNRVGCPRRISAKSSSLSLDDTISSPGDESLTAFEEVIPSMKVWLLFVCKQWLPPYS